VRKVRKDMEKENVFDLSAFAFACLKARKERALNQREVAKAVGISLAMYCNFENAARKPSPESLKRVCAFFNFDPIQFFVPAEAQRLSALGKKIKEAQHTLGLSDTKMRQHLGVSSRVFSSVVYLGKGQIQVISEICDTLGIPMLEEYLV